MYDTSFQWRHTKKKISFFIIYLNIPSSNGHCHIKKGLPVLVPQKSPLLFSDNRDEGQLNTSVEDAGSN